MKRAVFIGGCSRSGTTMLADLIGVGEKVVVTPESQFKVEAYRVYQTKGLDACLGFLKESFRLRVWGIDVSALSLSDVENFHDLMLLLVDAYARKHGKSDWNTWIDHTPTNTRDWFMLKTIFPDSKFVHIVRDGRAVFASMKGLDWGRQNAVHASDYWIERVAPGLALSSVDAAVQVRYEGIVESPEENLVKLCSEIDIGYSPEMLQGGGFSLPTYTKKQHRLVGKGVRPNKARAWMESLSDREIEIFEARAQSVLAALGYTLIHENPRNATKWERFCVGDWPVRILWRPTRRFRSALRRRRYGKSV